jgi:hypothetical protein
MVLDVGCWNAARSRAALVTCSTVRDPPGVAPAAWVIGDQPVQQPGLDPIEIRGDVDHPVYRFRINGVVVAEDRA